jgi:hypothetical protein
LINAVLKIRKMCGINIYNRVCDQFLIHAWNAAACNTERDCCSYITSKLLALCLLNPWVTELWTIPHSSKMWHQSARSNSANSNVASVRYATVNWVWRHNRNWQLWKTGRRWRVAEKWVHCSTFVRCVRFYGFAQFPAKERVLIAAGREVITSPCCFNDRHGTGFPYPSTFDLLRQWLFLKHARKNNQ